MNAAILVFTFYGHTLSCEVRCWGRSQKCIFWPFGPQFGLKMGVGVSPGSATVFVQIHIEWPLNGLNGQSMDNVRSKVGFVWSNPWRTWHFILTVIYTSNNGKFNSIEIWCNNVCSAKNVRVKVGLTGQLDWYPPQIVSSAAPRFSRVIITGGLWNLQFKKELGFLKKSLWCTMVS